MQGVPPIDGKLDDWDVDRADKGEYRGSAGGLARIFDRAPQGDEAEIDQEKHEYRSKARIPDPPNAPHWLAPKRAGAKAEQSKTGAKCRCRLLRRVGERMAPDKRAECRRGHGDINQD